MALFVYVVWWWVEVPVVGIESGSTLRGKKENSEDLGCKAQQGGGSTSKAQCTSLRPSMGFDVVCAEAAPLD